jgi:hypothetical protein
VASTCCEGEYLWLATLHFLGSHGKKEQKISKKKEKRHKEAPQQPPSDWDEYPEVFV